MKLDGWLVTGLGLLLAMNASAVPAAADGLPGGAWKSALATEGRIVITPEGLDRLLFPRGGSQWSPAVARFRGGTDLYEKVAPAVVVVRTETGHGTGFLVSADGWIVTNHHVVDSGLIQDRQKQASHATVHVGRLGTDGGMVIGHAPQRAYVYKMDRHRDLALLRLSPEPAGLPFLALSPKPPRPGMTASMVGHPSSGMLWTFRTGQISAFGRAPTDMVGLVMARLFAGSSSREQEIAEAIRQLPSRKIVLSSSGANPGDSGGPLVNSEGQVLAVTFAGPADPSEDKFTYHVHLDELKDFLRERPTKPMIVVPDPRDSGPLAYFEDFDGDGRPETLMLGDEEPDAILIDVSGRTPLAGIKDSDEAYEKLVAKKGWRFDFAIRTAGWESTVFYDTDADGFIDLILSAMESEKISARLLYTSTGWKIGEPGGDIAPFNLLPGPRGERLHAILQAMEKAE